MMTHGNIDVTSHTLHSKNWNRLPAQGYHGANKRRRSSSPVPSSAGDPCYKVRGKVILVKREAEIELYHE